MAESIQKPEDLFGRLRALLLFANLEDRELEDLTAGFELMLLPGGSLLFEEGDPGDTLYVLLRGRLRAFSGERTLGEIAPGECVGEMALLHGDTRSASVRAVRDSELVALKQSDFERLSASKPRMMMHMTRIIVQRLAQSNKDARPESNMGSFLVAPLNPSIDTRPFSQNLAKALAAFGNAGMVHRRHFEEALGESMPQVAGRHVSSRSIQVFGELEAAKDFLVMEAELGHESWTRLCFRHADCVILLADPAYPDIDLPEFMWLKIQQENGPRVELAVAHGESAVRPSRTRQWLDRLPVSFHHHLRQRAFSDFERLARMLTNRAMGLVLGGGGARGYAHIGAIRAFQEAGVPIDMVGGASMGAIIGAQLAMGWDVDKMMRVNRELFARKSLWDYTLPLVALTRGQRTYQVGVELYGDARIEDLWLPFFCVATSLSHASMKVCREGMVRRWVLASSAVPGMSPPVFIDGETLVDGAVVNNLPIDVMADLGRGPVAAISVSPPTDNSLGSDLRGGGVSPWRILGKRLNPLARSLRVPSLFNIILRTVMLSSRASIDAASERASLYINPPLESVSMLDFKKIDEAVQLGYEHTAKQLEDWNP